MPRDYLAELNEIERSRESQESPKQRDPGYRDYLGELNKFEDPEYSPLDTNSNIQVQNPVKEQSFEDPLDVALDNADSILRDGASKGIEEIELRSPEGGLTKRIEDKIMSDYKSVAFGLASVGNAMQKFGMSIGNIIEYGGNKTDIESMASFGNKMHGYFKSRQEISHGAIHASGAGDVLTTTVKDNPALLKDPRYWAYTVSEMAPPMLLMMGTGTGSIKVVQYAGKALKMTKQALSKLSYVGGVINGGIIGGSFEGGDMYRQLKDSGATEEEAQTAAEYTTFATGALNMITMGRLLSKLPPTAIGKGLHRTLSGLTNTFTEWLEEPAGVISKRLATGTLKDMESTIQELWHSVKEGVNVAPPSFLLGFLTGGLATVQGPKTTTTPTKEGGTQDVQDGKNEVREQREDSGSQDRPSELKPEGIQQDELRQVRDEGQEVLESQEEATETGKPVSLVSEENTKPLESISAPDFESINNTVTEEYLSGEDIYQENFDNYNKEDDSIDIEKEKAQYEEDILKELQGELGNDSSAEYLSDEGEGLGFTKQEVEVNAKVLSRTLDKFKLMFSRNKKAFESFEDSLFAGDFKRLKENLSKTIDSFKSSKSNYKKGIASQLQEMSDVLNSPEFDTLESNDKIWEEYKDAYYKEKSEKELARTRGKRSNESVQKTKRDTKKKKETDLIPKDEIYKKEVKKIKENLEIKKGEFKEFKDLKIEGKDLKTRGVSKRVEARAIEEMGVNNLGELPQYSKVNMKEQSVYASNLLEKDYELARRIATGEETNVPNGLIPEMVFLAVENKAVSEGDFQTIKDLATSKTTEIATQMGQRIRAYGERDPHSPVAAIKKISDLRLEKAKKRGDKTGARDQKTIDDLKAKLKVAENNLQDKISPKNVKSKKFGSENKIFTREGLESARKALNAKINVLHSGIDPTVAIHLTKIGGFYFEGGLRNFSSWSKNLIQEFGGNIRPYLKSTWNKISEDFREESFSKAKSKLQSNYEKYGDFESSRIQIQNIAEYFVSLENTEGSEVSNRKDLVKKVGTVLSDLDSNITDRQVADLISGYGQYKKLSEDSVKKRLSEFKGQLQQVSKLEDMVKGQEPLKTGSERRKPSKEEKLLIKQVSKMKKELGLDQGSRLSSLKSRLSTQIEYLNSKLKDKDFKKYDPKKIVLDQEARKLQIERDRIKKAYDIAKSAKEVISDKEIKTILELSKAASNSKTKIDRGSSSMSKSRMEYGRNIVKYENYVNDLKEDADKNTVIESMKNPLGLIYSAAGLTKSLVASLDNSVIGRQGLKVLYTHPTVWARNSYSSFADIVKTFGGKNTMDEVRADILSRENALNGMYKKEKLAVGVMEDEFPSSLPERIPIIGRAFKASENAFVGFQFRSRADIFDKMIEIADESGVKDVSGIGKFANSLTGRGDLGSTIEKIGNLTNVLFFSLRFAKSSLDILTGFAFNKDMSPFARKQAAKASVKYYMATAAVMAIANAFDEEAVELDPLSSDFGKFKVGNTRFDMTGGSSSFAILASRLWSSRFKSSATGEVRAVNDGAFLSRTRGDLVWDFFKNKLSPIAKTSRELWNQQTREREKPTIKSTLKGLFVPIIIQNYYELEDDSDSANTIVAEIMDAIGIGNNTYQYTPGGNKWATIKKIDKDTYKKGVKLSGAVFKERMEKFKSLPAYKNLPDIAEKGVLSKATIIKKVQRETNKDVLDSMVRKLMNDQNK